MKTIQELKLDLQIKQDEYFQIAQQAREIAYREIRVSGAIKTLKREIKLMEKDLKQAARFNRGEVTPSEPCPRALKSNMIPGPASNLEKPG